MVHSHTTTQKLRLNSDFKFCLYITKWKGKASNKNDEKKREYLNKIYKLKYEISVLFLAGEW